MIVTPAALFGPGRSWIWPLLPNSSPRAPTWTSSAVSNRLPTLNTASAPTMSPPGL